MGADGGGVGGTCTATNEVIEYFNGFGLQSSSDERLGVARADASATYAWDGPMGYPWGPENFAFHILINISGHVGVTGYADAWSDGELTATSNGGISMGLGRACNGGLSGNAVASGEVPLWPGSSSAYWDAEYEWGLDGFGGRDFPNSGSASYGAEEIVAYADYALLIDEDFEVNCQESEQLELQSGFYSDAYCRAETTMMNSECYMYGRSSVQGTNSVAFGGAW